MRRLILAGAFVFPTALAAQSSAYVPLDDPRLPLFEHIVARGDVADPSPQMRPFRRMDALVALLAADTAGNPSRRLIDELRGAWLQDTSAARWSFEGRAGMDAATYKDRDPLHPAGHGTLLPYGELNAQATFGPMVLVSRPAVEPRLADDPTWPGRHDLKVVGRMAEGYLSGQWHWARLFYGTMDRQWGPSGVPGIPLSNYGYPRTELAFEAGTPEIRLYANSAELTDDLDSTGARIHRYWFAHRLAISPSRRLAVALWETTIIAGKDRNYDPRWRNPLAVLLLSNQYGLGADGNIMVGTDLTWWASRRVRLEGQLAIDDIDYKTGRTPSRYAFTLAASGAVGASSAWRLLYTQASSLAFRTFALEERYADGTTGLGRGYASADQLSLFLTHPIRHNALLTPELTYLRQGDVRLTDPFPAAQAQAGQIGTLFIGPVEKTARAALGVSAWYGEIRASGNMGVHYIQDADHVAGRSRTELQANARITIGLGTGGRLQ